MTHDPQKHDGTPSLNVTLSGQEELIFTALSLSQGTLIEHLLWARHNLCPQEVPGSGGQSRATGDMSQAGEGCREVETLERSLASPQREHTERSWRYAFSVPTYGLSILEGTLHAERLCLPYSPTATNATTVGMLGGSVVFYEYIKRAAMARWKLGRRAAQGALVSSRGL